MGAQGGRGSLSRTVVAWLVNLSGVSTRMG